MKIAIALLALLLISAVLAESPCHCRPATKDERPGSGNEDIWIVHKTVGRIIGRAVDANDGPIKNAVVEVYECGNSDCDKFILDTNESTRLAACVADDDGRFCFPDLSSGRYILKFGTHERSGFQAVYLRIGLDRHWWSRWFKSNAELKITLPVAN